MIKSRKTPTLNLNGSIPDIIIVTSKHSWWAPFQASCFLSWWWRSLLLHVCFENLAFTLETSISFSLRSFPSSRELGPSEIVNFKVCKKGSFPLQGNVYVHCGSLDSVVLAYYSIHGRYYAGKSMESCHMWGVYEVWDYDALSGYGMQLHIPFLQPVMETFPEYPHRERRQTVAGGVIKSARRRRLEILFICIWSRPRN